MICIAQFILIVAILLDFCLFRDASCHGKELSPITCQKHTENLAPEFTPMDIADDIWAEIVFPHLDMEDYARLSGVSTYFHDLLRGEKYTSGIMFQLMALYRGIILLSTSDISLSNRFLSPEDERDFIYRTAVSLRSLEKKFRQYLKIPTSEEKCDSNFFIITKSEKKILALADQIDTEDRLTKLRDHYMTRNRALYESAEFKSILTDIHEGELPPTTFSSLFQRLIKNMSLMKSCAKISIAITCIGYVLGKIYPYYYPDCFQSLAHNAGLRAFDSMMNKTHLIVTDELGSYGCCSDRLELPAFFQTIPTVIKTRYLYQPNLYAHANGYVYFNETAHFVEGTVEDWVHFITSQGKCTYDFWIQHLYKLINPTEGKLPNPYNMVCSPNIDNTSICCGNVWSDHSVKDFAYSIWCNGDYCFRMIRGDAQQAYDEAYLKTMKQSFEGFAPLLISGAVGYFLFFSLTMWGYIYYS